MNQDFRNIDQVYTALYFEIPKEIIFEFKKEEVEKALKQQPFMNLKNFYLMKINNEGERQWWIKQKTKWSNWKI